MAKTKGPLMSLDAHGSFGRVLTYSHRKSGRQVRAYNKPLVTPSAKQRGQRRLTEFLVAQWQNMSAGDKATWEANARLSGPNIAGYHYFLREAQRDLYTHHGLCGYWHCNEIVGGQVLDLSGNANHGTLEPGYPANAPVLVDSYKTKFSKALLYDGVDEYVEIPHNAIFNFGTGDFTIIVWLYLDDNRDGRRFFSKWDYVTRTKGIALKTASGPTFTFSLGDGTSSNDVGNKPIVLKEWTRISTRRFGSTMDLYINNVFQGSASPANYNVDNIKTLVLGCDPWYGNHTKCIIDEVSIYNRKIEATELTTRYKFAMRKVD